jgi:hypothetical protein
VISGATFPSASREASSDSGCLAIPSHGAAAARGPRRPRGRRDGTSPTPSEGPTPDAPARAAELPPAPIPGQPRPRPMTASGAGMVAAPGPLGRADQRPAGNLDARHHDPVQPSRPRPAAWKIDAHGQGGFGSRWAATAGWRAGRHDGDVGGESPEVLAAEAEWRGSGARVVGGSPVASELIIFSSSAWGPVVACVLALASQAGRAGIASCGRIRPAGGVAW